VIIVCSKHPQHRVILPACANSGAGLEFAELLVVRDQW